MRSSKLLTVIISVLLIVQTTQCDQTTSSLPPGLEKTVKEVKTMLYEVLDRAFEVFQNVSQSVASHLRVERAKTEQIIIENLDMDMEKYEEMVDLADEAEVDIEMCRTTFNFDYADLPDFALLDKCINHTINDFTNAVYEEHKGFMEYVLNILYSIDREVMECKVSDQLCMDDVQEQLNDSKMISRSKPESIMYQKEKTLQIRAMDIDNCMNEYISMRRAIEIPNIQGFESCVKNVIKTNKRGTAYKEEF